MAQKITAGSLVSSWDLPPTPGESAEHYLARARSESQKFLTPRRERLQMLVQRLDEKAKSGFRRGIVSVDELSAEFCSNPQRLHRYLKEQILLLIDRHPEILAGSHPPVRPGKMVTKPSGATKWSDEALLRLWLDVEKKLAANPRLKSPSAVREILKKPPAYLISKGEKTPTAASILNQLSLFKRNFSEDVLDAMRRVIRVVPASGK